MPRRLTKNQSKLDINEIEQELNMARRIQAYLLPKSLPQNKRFSTSAYYEPSKTTSGDFYDVLPMENDQFGMVIPDACGKGLPAAMLISQLQDDRTMLALKIYQSIPFQEQQ